MKLRIMLVLITCMFPTCDAATEPYGDAEDHQSASMYSAEGDDEGYLTNDEAAFPNATHNEPAERAKHYSRHRRAAEHVALNIDRTAVEEGVGAIQDEVERRREDTSRSAAPSAAPTVASMKSFIQVNPQTIFDREQYLREHVNRLIEDEKRYKTASRVCRWCNVSWLGVGGVSTASSLIISAIGATAYVEPRLANVLNIVFGVVSGGCLWAASQSKKASHTYHEEATAIQKALGVPERLVAPEVDLHLDAFKADTTGRQPDVPAAAH